MNIGFAVDELLMKFIDEAAQLVNKLLQKILQLTDTVPRSRRIANQLYTLCKNRKTDILCDIVSMARGRALTCMFCPIFVRLLCI